jgi:biopolymer transport protein TolR
MGAKLGSSGSDDEAMPISDINITPFVDVVLVLLVIFMVTAPALMKDVIGIQLPKAASPDPKVMQMLSVAVTKQGQILMNGQVTTEDSLSTEVRSNVAKNPDLQVIISADQEAKHGDVVRAIDLVKTAGVSKFAFQIERR